MRGRKNRQVPIRAIIAVIAFYGLVFQAFFAGATAAPSPKFIGVICAHDDAGPPADGDAAKRGHPCCTAACSIQTVFKGAVPTMSVLAVARPAATVTWQPEFVSASPHLSVRSASARGPPGL